MCGINGIFAYHYAANSVERDELVRTRDHMAARGPDGCGAWISADNRIGLGHRRLAIIDLSDAGSQPMLSADGKLVVSFNGEIYNYRELRRELEVKGCHFSSQSDTEVLLHLYAQKGMGMMQDLRGMFAFAIWDADRRRLVLARDPYGIKPLYYADDGWTFRFASSVKALLAGGAVPRELEPAGQVGFYLFGSIPEPFTIYQAIRALPAGSTMTVDRIGSHEPDRYHSIAKVYRDAEAASAKKGQDVAQEMVREALRDSVRHHLVADVAVGAFLSAGIDSGALVGLMRDAGQHDIQTVTLTFGEFKGRAEDEAPIASEVARLYGTRHTTRTVSGSEFASDLPRILEAMDQPSIDGINIWFVSKAARELGLKVAISGLGGDELFGGYPSFRDIPRWVALTAVPSRVPLFGRASRMAGEKIARITGANVKAAGFIELGGTYAGAYLLRRGLFMPWELARVLGRETAELGLRRLAPLHHIEAQLEPYPASALARVSTLESALYMRNQLLRDADWASMAHSLEVRVPLVDSHLLSATARSAAHIAATGKQALAAAPMRLLPSAVSGRRKTGFTIPLSAWKKQMATRDLNARPARGEQSQYWARDWSSLVGDFFAIRRDEGIAVH